MLVHYNIVQRDDGMFSIGLDGLGPFETWAFAATVAIRLLPQTASLKREEADR